MNLFTKKKIKNVRETGDSEAEINKGPKNPDIGRKIESRFFLLNEYSRSIKVADSDFIHSKRTCKIAITADKSVRTAFAADFRREYKNIDFL